jgi:hypothetical protein
LAYKEDTQNILVSFVSGIAGPLISITIRESDLREMNWYLEGTMSFILL